jgi:hypothetical protein
MFLVKLPFFDVRRRVAIGVVLLRLTLVTGMLWDVRPGAPTGVDASPPQRCSSSCTSVISRADLPGTRR